MKKFLLISVFLVVILLFYIFIIPELLINKDTVDDYFVGVSFGGDSIDQAKLLIDRVKSFTNLFVVQSGPASKNETLLNEVCDYAVDSELSIIVYFGKFDLDWQPLWLDKVKDKWGDKFLGIYFFDEPAGSLLDSINEMWNESLGPTPKNYNEMAEYFVDSWQSMPGLITVKDRLSSPVTFTSDYALYWFDYLAGYDVVLTQFGWNHSRIQDIALIRGAARLQDKEWGTIVTWTFDQPPYLQDGQRLYEDLMIAYNNGAKYFVVFNYPKLNEYGILTDEHFIAIEKFWDKIQDNPKHSPITANTALVLPKNYGYGIRRIDDTIWGLWEAEEKSEQIWNITRELLDNFGTKLDIVYDDSNFSLEDKYSRIFYWNSTSN